MPRAFDDRARALGFEPVILRGTDYDHASYAGTPRVRSGALHVYIEHDGTPWIAGVQPSDEPTPRRPLALELMARDTGPRLLLGRPCYFGHAHDPGCDVRAWTHGRYAPEIVASMAAALRSYILSGGYGEVVLIGYSGGGTLAWLIAPSVPQVRAVVTIAANLDVARWASLHGYTPLDGSLDPARLPRLDPAIRQLHYAGGRDANVPSAIIESFAARQGVRAIEVPEFDHVCCWVERWPALLRPAEGPNAD